MQSCGSARFSQRTFWESWRNIFFRPNNVLGLANELGPGSPKWTNVSLAMNKAFKILKTFKNKTKWKEPVGLFTALQNYFWWMLVFSKVIISSQMLLILVNMHFSFETSCIKTKFIVFQMCCKLYFSVLKLLWKPVSTVQASSWSTIRFVK